ncbi:VOC family protein [Promicromonospora sp. NPDC060271]|uniref:VOC family protein n=1 Tax=Promicromonospora sp. NPDC060271 TaxID=3347089 RepID=UPI00365BEA18
MTDTYPAFDMGPVPLPALDAEPAELFRGIYGMPMFVNAPTRDMAASVEFWTHGLGFFEFFAAPGRVTHLRRWAFQDVLLVPADAPSAVPTSPPAMTVTFSCVLSQVDQIAAACEGLVPGSTTGPRQTPWNTVDLEVVTPENVRVIMTAARPYDPAGAAAQSLRDELGIEGPSA